MSVRARVLGKWISNTESAPAGQVIGPDLSSLFDRWISTAFPEKYGVQEIGRSVLRTKKLIYPEKAVECLAALVAR
jgi:hypothetical protein